MMLLGAALALLGLALALAAVRAWQTGRRQRELLGLPAGRVVAADTGGWAACDRPLYSARYRLAGKPDYLVEAGRSLVPVEVKPGRRAANPYASDILQLGAYLLLVEEATRRRPPYGLLCYAGRTFEIQFTPLLKRRVIACLAEMRHLRRARNARRQHDEAQRCLRCGHREHCGGTATAVEP